jgi:hypothetical protein
VIEAIMRGGLEWAGHEQSWNPGQFGFLTISRLKKLFGIYFKKS